jgi:hypothetical protein
MTQCFVKPEARKSRSHFPLGSRQRTLSLPSDVERKLASMVDASSAGGTAGEEGSEARQDRMERVRARANNAMSQGGALVNMNPAAIDSYEGGYAALHWNADGRFPIPRPTTHSPCTLSSGSYTIRPGLQMILAVETKSSNPQTPKPKTKKRPRT